jgi:Asp-tRNA(Asn)/Glu-tRNA(Gln) amidotransferase A subunit family amidase
VHCAACGSRQTPLPTCQTGLLDEALLRRLTAAAFPANLAGLPAVTVPVGLDRADLPVGPMLVGARDSDETVLRAAAHLERAGIARVPQPGLWIDILQDR